MLLRNRLALVVAVVCCIAATPSLARGSVAVGFNIGLDIPSGDSTLGPGGVWHLALDYVQSPRLSIAAELGTAANPTDADRTVLVHGIPREISFHAVSTLGLVARYGVRPDTQIPYVLLGADYYFSWDELRDTPEASGTSGRDGFGLPFGAGILLKASSRWDFYGEGLYHLALDADDDASYAAFQGGIRFHFARRP